MSGRINGGIFEKQTFTRADIPNWCDKELVEMIVAAIGLGWKMHISSAQSITLASWDDRKKYHFNVGRRSTIPRKRVKRDIVRLAKPEAAEAALSAMELHEAGADLAAINKHTRHVPALGQPGTVIDHRPAMEAEEQQKRASAERKKAEMGSTPKKEVASSNPQRLRIVNSKPMISKIGEKRGYESPTTLERTWSDGSRDYACRYPGCDYSATGRGSVPSHYSNVHSRGKGRSPQPEGFEADVSEARHYKPRPVRVANLAAHLAKCMEEGITDPEALAREALVWVHENPRTREDGEAEEVEEADMAESTPEQVLDRIRMMLDGGALAEARAREAALEERVVAAEAAAERAKGTLRTFLDLAREEAGDDVAEAAS